MQCANRDRKPIYFNLSIHQRPTDTRCLEPHLEKVQQILGKWPKTVITDAGYGSEEKYAYLEKKEIQAVVKYGSYHKEKTKAWKANVGKIENWTYDTPRITGRAQLGTGCISTGRARRP
ncbi:transposase [Paenibacillus sp. FSL R7-0333]|uniref:transposase n=1 Tax=Paenibacillus sp. FSL R7-0333 TaxID=1926587 RepID=UPI0030FD1990